LPNKSLMGGNIVEKLSEGEETVRGVKRKMFEGGKQILFCDQVGKENTRF